MNIDSAGAKEAANDWEETFPPEIDIPWMLQTYPKLSEANDKMKWFIELGEKAGFCGSFMAHQKEFCEFLTGKFRNKRVLELGPGNFPRFAGPNTYYFDAKTPAELAAQYKRWKQPVDRIPERIHYVEPHGDLSVIPDRFDLVFSSHNIEHVIDLVRHFQDVEKLLAPNGIYALSIPDRRYTFDYYRKESGLGEILAQYYQPSINHPLAAVLDYRLNMAHNHPKLHWADEHGELPDHRNEIESIVGEYDPAGFVDIHRWVFTRDSFVRQVAQLCELGLIKLRVIRCYNVPRDANGFNAILVKTPG